jgi:hypothetical protein
VAKNKIYNLKVTIHKNIYRIIGVRGNCNLYKLAQVIIDAFNFDFDHAFGFYNNIKDMYKSDEIYELFVESGYEGSPGAKGVSKIYVSDVFEIKKKMLFLFDYGDGWEIIVECIDIAEPVAKLKYPQLLAKKGASPKQYA